MQAVFRSGLCAAMILLGACSPKPETAPKEAAEQGEKMANASGEKAENSEKGEKAGKAEKSGEAGELSRSGATWATRSLEATCWL